LGNSSFAKLAILSPIIILGVTSFLSYERLTNVYYRINVLPATLILDLLILVVSFSTITKSQKRTSFFVIVFCIIYLSINSIFIVFDTDLAFGKKDFILWFKPYFYLIILAYLCSRKQIIEMKTVDFLFKFLVIIGVLKYSVAKIIFGIPRPGLFTENNFEIMLFIMLYIFLLTYHKVSILWTLGLTFLVIMSGSKVGFVVLVYVIASTQKNIFRLLLKSLIIFPLFIFITFLVSPRILEILDITTLDRFRFLMVFLNEIGSFEIRHIIFGQYPMTPLSDESCKVLSFYKSLFSNHNLGICFPVILHSFFLKSLLEHGIFGVSFIIIAFYKLLRLRGYSKKFVVTAVVVLSLNGLSVSGFSNTYAMLGITLITLTKLPRLSRNQENERRMLIA
jgi:hypothetical protein